MGNIVSVEVDILNDFIDVDGALSVPGADKLRSNFKRLAEIVDSANLFRVAVRDCHFADNEELQSNGGPWPEHAMVGTPGAEVIPEMEFAPHAACLPDQLKEGFYCDDLDYYKWLIKESIYSAGRYFSLEKQTYKMSSNPSSDLLMELLDTEEALVSGVATEICVLSAVLYLQENGVQCYVVKDAIAGIDDANIEKAIEQMADAGAIFVDLDDVEEMIHD